MKDIPLSIKNDGVPSHQEKGPQALMLLYDGDCSMCRNMMKVLEKMGLLHKADAVAWATADIRDQAIEEKIRTEMVLMDKTTGEVLTGMYALNRLAIVHHRFWVPRQIFKIPGVSDAITALYHIVSFNRRVLFPFPKPKIACTCDPPFQLDKRIALWAFISLGALLSVLLLSVAMDDLMPNLSWMEVIIGCGLSLLSGWVVNFAVFPLLLRGHYIDFVEQSLVVMGIGSLGILAIALMTILGDWSNIPIEFLKPVLWVGLGLNSIIMLRSIYLRTWTFGAPRWVPWVWFILFILPTTFCLFYFKLLTA
ncbi:MAG: DUF393 domain-containing protein [Cyanobacteria bacterium]|nr:DUF393 domain-containing protein [Cyanobacteriota bacterium]